MKRRFFIGVSVLTALIIAVCLMVSCVGNEGEENPGTEVPDSPELRTVEIICGETRTVKAYEVGTEIKLKADLSANEVFVCWLSEGVPFSYEREAVYKVTEDAVVKAIYASYDAVTLDTDGGVLPDDYKVTVIAYGGTELDVGGALLVGYQYILPVPVKDNYTFVGWSAEDSAVTDQSGKSLGEYNGNFTEFRAVYKENPFVNIVLKNGETGEVFEQNKVYIEDGSVRITAPEITDRECTGWTRNGEKVSSESEFVFSLSGSDIVSGQTYEFVADYREAFRFTVISGLGGGKYARDDVINVSAIIPTGNDFRGWMVSFEGEDYFIGRIGTESESVICLISSDGESVKYYSEETGETVTVSYSAEETEQMKSGTEETFTLGDFEKLGMVINGGANTLIRAEFSRKEHTLVYTIDCMIDGVYCLDKTGETALLNAGFSKSQENDGTFVKEEYYNYNENIVLSSVPSISHYKFGNWENADGSGKIPSTMPNGNLSVRGTFVPEKHRISVVCDTAQGSVKIGAGSTTSGYYNYGQTLTIYVVAQSGYKFAQWLDRDNADASDRVKQSGDEIKTDTISYVYTYRVEQDEDFTVRFTERDYTITYILTVYYDGQEITDNEAFFEEGGYKEGYNVFVESRNYGVRGSLMPVPVIKSADNPDGIALIYGAENWTVNNWKADKEGLGNLNDFVMPKEDITVRTECVINSYTVGFSKQEGVKEFALEKINGKDPAGYLSGTDYLVPYASKFEFSVTMDNGYRYGDVKVNGTAIGGESGYESTETGTYESEVEFILTRNDITTVYVFYAQRNYHTVTYYIRADYIHNDEDKLLSGYLTYDESQVKSVNGEDYYLVTGIKNASGDMQSVTKEGMTYGQALSDPAVNAEKERYGFSGWTRMSGETVYSGSTMPDGDIWVYGNLSLMSYNVSIAKNTFKFDDNTDSVNTANINVIVENGEENVYDDTNPFEESEHLYFSAITVETHDPTGYDFVMWKITSHTDGQSDVVIQFDITDAEVGVVNKIESNGKVFKYVLNADKTITIYLTENSVIEATFAVQTFTAKSLDGKVLIKIPTAGTNRFATECTFEYGTNLDLMYNYTALEREGQKMMSFIVSEDEESTAVTEEISSGYDEDSLTYPTPSIVMNTTETAYTTDIFVEAKVEDINYKIFYTIYPSAASLGFLSGGQITVNEAVDGTPFTMKLNDEKTLLGEAETKQLAEANRISTDNTMYSGWYDGKTLSSSTHTEGKGMSTALGSYAPEREYTHTAYNSHVYVSCYLVTLVTAEGGEAGVNDVIVTTSNYKTHFNSNYKSVEIPSSGTDGNPVTALRNDAFNGLNSLEEIILPDGITEIGERAFKDCTKLKDTGLTDSVAVIGREAYMGCDGITEITVGENVYSIGDRAFSEMENLKTINYLSGATQSGLTPLSVGSGVFASSGKYAENGMELVIGIRVSVIVKNLFCSTDSEVNGMYLTTVSFAEGEGARSVTIAGSAFANTALENFNSSPRLVELGESAFGHCFALGSVDLSSSNLIEIGSKAFEYSSITEIILSETTKTVGSYAFSGCEDLVSVYYSAADGLGTIGIGAFRKGDAGSGDQKLVRITNISEKEKTDGGEKVIRLENVSSIGDEAFYYCKQIKEVYIGGENTMLGARILAGASSLGKVTYAVINGLDKTGTSGATFTQTLSSSCELIIESNVESVPDYAFYGFTAVNSLTVPENIQSIGTQAFGSMTGLKEVYFNAGNYECEENAEPFYLSGASSGLKVIFGNGISVIKAGLFYGASNMNAIQIPESANLSLTIEKQAFAGTDIGSVDFPVRQGITVKENAFESVPVTSLTVAEGNTGIEFYAGAFSSSASPSEMSVSIFGREMESLWGTLTDGTLTLTKTAEGIEGLLMGAMATAQGVDFTVEKGDKFTLSGSATQFTVTTGATVHGKLLMMQGASVEKANTAEFFKAVAYDKTDFEEKNGFTGGYTYLKIAENIAEIEFTEAIEVNAEIFETASDLTLNFGGTLNVSQMIVGNGIAASVYGTFTLTGTLQGEITAKTDSVITISNHLLTNDGTVPENLYGETGLRVINGSTAITQTEQAFSYNVRGEIEINYDYLQYTGWGINVESGGVLTVSAVAELSKYSAEEGGELTVTETGVAKLRGYRELSGKPLWTVDTAVSMLDASDDVMNYFGTFELAMGSSQRNGEEYFVEKDLSIAADCDMPSNTIILNFKENTSLSFTNNAGFELQSTLTLINANIVSTGETPIFSVGGELVLESGTITAEGTVAQGINVSVNSGASIISSGGAAIEAGSKLTVNGTVKGKTYGIIVAENVNTTSQITVTGEVKATSGTGIRVSGTGSELILESGATVEGYTGIEMIYPSGATVTGNPSLNIKEGATVTGTRIGVVHYGGGYSVIDGTVTANAVRESAVTDGNEQSYAGAVVVVEKGDDSSADAKAVIGGSITNTSGDAVIYVGYGRGTRGNGYKAVTLNETASINGNVVELIEAYEQSSASDGIDMEIYAVSGGKMTLFTNTTEAGAGDKFEYKNALNIDSSYTVTVDYAAEGIDDVKARYVLYTENIAGACGKNGIIRVGTGILKENIPSGETVAVNGAIDINATESIEINGTVVMLGGGKLNILSPVSLNGVLKGIKGINESSFSLQNSLTVNNDGTIDINDKFIIEAEGELTVNGTVNIGEGTQLSNYGSLVTEQNSALSGNGELILEAVSYSEFNKNPSNLKKLTFNGGAVGFTETLNMNEINFLSGEYTINVAVSVQTFSAGTAKVTFENNFTVENQMNLEKDSEIVLKGVNVLKNQDNNTLTGIITVEGDTSITGNGVLQLSGILTVSAAVNIYDGTETGSIDVIKDENGGEGRLIIKDGAAFSVSNITIAEASLGIEYYGGTISFEVEEGSQEVTLIDGAWVFIADGLQTPSIDSQEDNSEKIESEINNDDGTVKGKIISYCLGHTEFITVEPTCGDYGYTACVNEIKGTLSDGTAFVVKHERKDIIPPTGAHTYQIDAESGVHYCTECGLVEEHTFELMVAYTGNEQIMLNGKKINVLAKQCTICGDGATVLILDSSVTEKAFNEMDLYFNFSMSEWSRELKVSALNDSDEKLISKAEGGVTYKGEDYYAVKVNVYALGQGYNYYVLVRHNEHYYKVNEDGTHTCIACGENREEKHELNSYTYGRIENGTDVYGEIRKSCDICLREETFVITASTLSEVNDELTGIGSVAFAGTKCNFSLAAPEGTIAGKAKFTYRLNGETYYVLEITVRDGSNNVKEYQYTDESGTEKTAPFVVSVKYSGTNVVIGSDGVLKEPDEGGNYKEEAVTAEELNALLANLTATDSTGATYSLTVPANGFINDLYSDIVTDTDGKKYNICTVTLMPDGNGSMTEAKIYVLHKCTVSFELRTIGGKEVNVITSQCSCCGEGEFKFAYGTTVESLKNGLSNFIFVNENDVYDIDLLETDSAMELFKIKEYYYEYNMNRYDLIPVKVIRKSDGESTMDYYIAVRHECTTFIHVGNDVCAECGASSGVPHEETLITTKVFAVGSENIVFLAKVCPVCGVGTPVIANADTVSGVNTILAGITMEGYGYDKDGNALKTMLMASLIEDSGTLSELYSFTVKLTANGNIVEISSQETGTVYDVAYVGLKNGIYENHGVYAILIAHTCHDFEGNSDGTGHICTECGKAYGEGDSAHLQSYYVLTQLALSDAETVNVIGTYCNFCGKTDVYYGSAKYMNDVKSNLTSVSIDGQSYGISFVDKIIDYVTRPDEASSGKTYEYGGETYYLWEVTVNGYGGGTLSAYVLVAQESLLG